MRIINSLIVPKIVKRGLLGFFNIHSVAKHQKQYERGAFEDFKKFPKKKIHKAKKGRGSVIGRTNGRGHQFWVLHFKVKAFGCVQNQVLNTFGKSE